jgi:hypothetical protein
MRQSVRLMVERTRVDWGLVSAAVAAEKWQASCSAQQETEALICRTGCVMDDHHWREGEFCRRSGKACEHSEAEDWLRR